MTDAQTPPETVPRRLYSVAEFAETLGISKAYGYELVWSHRVRHVRLGSRILIPVEAIDDFVASLADDDQRSP